MIKSKPHISLRRLRVFCIAAEHDSFRDAAAKMFITASAVSHQIKQLEQELGQKLFDRSSTSLNLTGVGKALFDDLSPLLLQVEEAALRYAKTAAGGTLCISVQPFFFNELFVPRLPEFTAMYPDLDIKIDTSDETAEKHPTHADVSIRLFKTPPAKLDSTKLFPLRLIPAGSPDFQKNMKVKSRKIVSPFPLIVHEGRPNAWKQWAQSAGVELPDSTNSVRLDSMSAIAKAAERGLGAALIPVQLASSWFDSGKLEPLFKHELTTSDTYHIVSGPDSGNQVNVRLFRDWALANLVNPR